MQDRTQAPSSEQVQKNSNSMMCSASKNQPNQRILAAKIYIILPIYCSYHAWALFVVCLALLGPSIHWER